MKVNNPTKRLISRVVDCTPRKLNTGWRPSDDSMKRVSEEEAKRIQKLVIKNTKSF